MRTDAEGRFEINELDETLMFRVLVIASGRRAVVTDYIDPSQEELDLKLSPMPEDIPPSRLLRGRVVNEAGRPVSGALVTPYGAKTSERRWWGSLPGVDAASVTDDEGHFVVTSRDPKLGLDVEVTAPGFAINPGKLFPLDGQRHEIRLQRGATVLGSLLWEGKGVASRAVGIVQRDRSSGQFVGEVTLATDEQGQFVFPNLQTNQSYVLYTLCSGAKDEPVLKQRTIDTGANHTDVDVGDLELVAGLTLAGRAELPSGTELPADAKLRLSRDLAWDWCEVALQPDGSFVARGLPPEVLTVGVTAPGFTLDTSRLRFQPVGENRFALRLRKERQEIVIPLRTQRQPD